ncbi:hypothetical protein DAPPPG734_22550 (plasmid) [Pantoea agglomerans]|uniref:Uncharacterized protein n=1 Tax=Enterobacter agglomerans TaxID=549 RepID=A0AAN2FGK4_ENTAG|nr:hypothetical protein DAPPPG734_22550 [Pantoea agglomerans]
MYMGPGWGIIPGLKKRSSYEHVDNQMPLKFTR